jgi:SAM-dependent methyltransferase
MYTNKWPKIFPPLPNTTEMPHWTGTGFQVGERVLPILSYEVGPSGWTDDLTTFHESTAGDSHFIDIASRRQAVSQVAQYNLRETPVILDIGCSSGFLLADLKIAFPRAFVMGADVVPGPLLNLATNTPDIPLLHFDLTHCPLPDNSLDVAVLLNVLEHIEDDALAVRQLYRILKPGGIAVIEVPAGPELFDIYDELLMHYRRYKLPDLRQIFLDSKFKILWQSHLGFSLYPGFFLVKQLRRKKRADISEDEIPTLVSQNINGTGKSPFFHALMWLELTIGKVISYPFGIRCLLTVQKPLQYN